MEVIFMWIKFHAEVSQRKIGAPLLSGECLKNHKSVNKQMRLEQSLFYKKKQTNNKNNILTSANKMCLDFGFSRMKNPIPNMPCRLGIQSLSTMKDEREEEGGTS